LVVGVGIGWLGRPEGNEMGFLSHFRYTATVVDDDMGHRLADYRIYGDRASILAAIPGAAAAKGETIGMAIQYDFYLPSGKAATLTCSTKRPDGPHDLEIDAKITPWWYRVLHRLGLD